MRAAQRTSLTIIFLLSLVGSPANAQQVDFKVGDAPWPQRRYACQNPQTYVRIDTLSRVQGDLAAAAKFAEENVRTGDCRAIQPGELVIVDTSSPFEGISRLLYGGQLQCIRRVGATKCYFVETQALEKP